MTRDDHEWLVNNVILPRCREIRLKKGKNYSGSDDCLANFKRTAAKHNLNPMVVLMIFLNKHLDAIASYVNGTHEDDGETIDDRVCDAINFLLLLLGLIHEKDLTSFSQEEKQ